MKFPKRWPNRVRKSLIPDKNSAAAKKLSTPLAKPTLSDWKRRWFLSVAAIIAVLIGVPALAQNALSSGPVHFPATTNAPAVTPVSAPLATPVPAATSVAPQPTDASDTEDIHDIRGPISIPYEWLWAAYIVAGLLIAAALYGAWRFFARHAAAKAKLPFEIALEKLESARALMTEDRVREYAFTVSEIIRVYIEKCFHEKAANRTTEEFLSDLLRQTDTPLAHHRRRLEDFLSHCDLMKFARWEASVREMESMHESARVFVLETRPQPEPAKSATPSAPAAPQPELVQAK